MFGSGKKVISSNFFKCLIAHKVPESSASINSMKNDKYRKARGGWSRVYDVSCDVCFVRVCAYQKDGPGPLKRMYFDRMLDVTSFNDELVCVGCKSLLGIKIVYEKENRLAYRLFVGSVKKALTGSRQL